MAKITDLFCRPRAAVPKKLRNAELLVTLWPSFPHFKRFAGDNRLAGIRLNSAMISVAELKEEFALLPKSTPMPLYFDIKGRQLRVTEVRPHRHHLDISINHPIRVDTPTPVLFKAGADQALLTRVIDGTRLIFDAGARSGPHNQVKVGESLHIRDKNLVISGEQFTSTEIEKIEQVKAAGFKHWFLSYVECQRDVDEFLERIGKDCEVMLKIENKKGLEYVAREFKKRGSLRLVAAQGDMYVEVDKPHHILEAMKLIVEKDPTANVGSRMMLSTITEEVPSCADFEQLAWLYDIGYRSFMLCDELCLKEPLLARGVNAFCAFKNDYSK